MPHPYTPLPSALARAFALCGAALLAGCAAGPDFQAPTVTAPPDFASWHGGSDELLATSPRQAAPLAPAGWALFADPVLAQLQARALQANADLRTATLRFAQSRAMGDATRAGGMPQLGLSAGESRVRASENGDFSRVIGAINPGAIDEIVPIIAEPHYLYQAGFDASWELDLWGRVRRAVEAADADDGAAQALLAQVRLSVQAEVARRYFEVRSTQQQIALAREEVALGEELRELVAASTTRGRGTDTDLRMQDAQVADARARLSPLLAQEAQAVNQLTLLVGERPGALASLLAAPPAHPAANAPDLSLGLPSEVALRRPDIQQAQARLHVATARIGVAQADLYPRITIGAQFGFESVDADTFTDWGSRRWSIGPSLQLPLFDGGRRRATVALRELQQQEAAVAWQQTVLKAWHEIDDTLNAYAAERQRNLRLGDMEGASRDAWELARTRYAHGLTDLLPALDAQRTLLQAQRARTDSTGRLSLNLVAVSKALGVAPAAPQAIGAAPTARPVQPAAVVGAAGS